MDNKKLKDGYQLEIIGILLVVVIHLADILKNGLNFMYSIFCSYFYYGWFITIIGLFACAFWVRSFSLILINFIYDDLNDEFVKYKKSKYYLAFSLILILVASLLFFNAKGLVNLP